MNTRNPTELEERIRRMDAPQAALVTVKQLGVRTLRELHELLDTAHPEEVQAEACAVAGWIGDGRASPLRLVRLLETTESEVVGQEAASALGFVNSKPARRRLRRVLREHPEPKAREWAAYGLLNWAEDDDLSDLLAALSDEGEEPAVRARVAETIGWAYQFSRLRRHLIPHLLRALENSAAELRFWGCYALAQIGDEREIPAIERLLDDHTMVPRWWSVRREARWAIETIRADARWRRMSHERRHRLFESWDPVEWPKQGEV